MNAGYFQRCSGHSLRRLNTRRSHPAGVEETNEPPSSMRDRTVRSQTPRTQYGSEDVAQLQHLPRGHHTTMQNARNTPSESTRPGLRTCTPSHLHDACTVRDSTVCQSVGGASRPRRHTAPRRHLPIGRLLSRDEVKLQLPRVHTVFAAKSGRPTAVECLNTKTPAQPAA